MCLLLILSVVIMILLIIYRIAIVEFHTITYKPRSKIEESMLNPKSYKPVIIVHGLLDQKSNAQLFTELIKEIHPGTEVIFIDLYVGIKSFAPLWDQVAKFRDAVETVCISHPEGVNIIGFSQGGLIGRGIIESSNIHNIKTFVSVVGPQLGQYGLSEFEKWPFYQFAFNNIHRFFYSRVGDWLSVAEVWRDPGRLNEYREKNIFLPILNNEIQHSRYDENLVLIGGPDDGIITPWQSSQFAFVDATGNVTSMENQEIYVNDTFGLRTLQERGGIVKYTIPKVDHRSFQRNAFVVKECVIPHLD